MPSCLAVQHVEPEPPFGISTALRAAGVEVDVRRVFADEPLPSDLDGFAALVVMGGPMSAASNDGFPTRLAEVTLILEAIDRGLPLLGVCLGAQLLALAAGGSVYAGPSPEIGWGPVEFTPAAAADPLLHGLPDRLEVLHWHGDTYVPPSDAIHLASSPAYAEQAFRCGPNAWGLQFHLEVDRPAVDGYLAAFADEARGAGVDPEQIRSETPAALSGLAPYRDAILGRFAALVAGSGSEIPVAGQVIESA